MNLASNNLPLNFPNSILFNYQLYKNPFPRSTTIATPIAVCNNNNAVTLVYRQPL